jgi:hypothetical protein
MPTTAIATAIFNTLRTKLSAADATVRIHGKTLIGLLASPTVTERTQMYGADEGYEGSLYLKVADLPAQGIEDGDLVSFKEGSKWIDRRIMSIETKSGVVKRCSMQTAHR